MNLQSQINGEIKNAMKTKDTLALDTLRAIKSAILLAQTESGAKEELSKDDEIKLLQRLVKQRKESARIYTEQGREDLAQPEVEQAKIIEKFLPQQLSEDRIKEIVSQIITDLGVSGMASMGQVMAEANKRMAGQADGKTISTVVRSLLV
ncbi:MAG: GatB/YqeY domain-containing protein [Flavobacteriaceae bacterium]